MLQALKAGSYISLGFIGGLALIIYFHMKSMPYLEVWHKVDLDIELTADTINRLVDFRQYQSSEEQLFQFLDSHVTDKLPDIQGNVLNRFYRKSISHPDHSGVNWNKSFEMKVQSPKASVLMLHGLSDSPYSMRSLAQHRIRI